MNANQLQRQIEQAQSRAKGNHGGPGPCGGAADAGCLGACQGGMAPQPAGAGGAVEPGAYAQQMQQGWPGHAPGQPPAHPQGGAVPQGGAAPMGGPMQPGHMPPQPGCPGGMQVPHASGQPGMQGGAGQPPGAWPGMGYSAPGPCEAHHPAGPGQGQQRHGYAPPLPQHVAGMPMQPYAAQPPDGSSGQQGCPQGMMPGMMVQTPQGMMVQTPQGLMLVQPNMMQPHGGQHLGGAPGGMQFVMLPGQNGAHAVPLQPGAPGAGQAQPGMQMGVPGHPVHGHDASSGGPPAPAGAAPDHARGAAEGAHDCKGGGAGATSRRSLQPKQGSPADRRDSTRRSVDQVSAVELPFPMSPPPSASSGAPAPAPGAGAGDGAAASKLRQPLKPWADAQDTQDGQFDRETWEMWNVRSVPAASQQGKGGKKGAKGDDAKGSQKWVAVSAAPPAPAAPAPPAPSGKGGRGAPAPVPATGPAKGGAIGGVAAVPPPAADGGKQRKGSKRHEDGMDAWLNQRFAGNPPPTPPPEPAQEYWGGGHDDWGEEEYDADESAGKGSSKRNKRKGGKGAGKAEEKRRDSKGKSQGKGKAGKGGSFWRASG